MESSLNSHGSSWPVRGWALGGVVTALLLSLAFVTLGCGSKAKPPAVAGTEKPATPQKTATHGGAKGKTAAKTSAKSAEKPKSAEKTKTAERSKAVEKPGTAEAKAAEKAPEKTADKPATKVIPVSGGGSIRLVDRGCVSFEPHWTTIRVGQSLTWHSDLKMAVTIHVPPGAFERTEFVVPAKGTVHSGPAQNPGDHEMWSAPAACQAAPLGVQGAGPGVTIEAGVH